MARYFANTNSFIQMQVTGNIPTDRFTWLAERLKSNAFMSIEDTTDEASAGWTRADNIDDSSFDVPTAFMRDNYGLFTLRMDQRRIAGAVLSTHVAREEKLFLADHLNLRRTPKAKRDEIKELVKLRLLAKTQPVPSLVDVAWDMNTGIVYLFSTSTSVIDRFESIFRKTFEGFNLTVIHPFARAQGLVTGDLLDSLNAANQANSDGVTAMIKDNRWLGYDFLLWLLYRGLNDEPEYKVCTPGTQLQGEVFASWIDDRIVMEGGGEEGGIQKVSVTGSQDQYKEVRSALVMNKHITSAMICMEQGEHMWKLTVDGGMFSFKSCKCPGIRIEKDSTVDEMNEIEAVFYEKIYLIQQGLQYFNSLLLAFLQARLGASWGEQRQTIQEWLETE